MEINPRTLVAKVITDWQHWVLVIAQVALVLSNLDTLFYLCKTCYAKTGCLHATA